MRRSFRKDMRQGEILVYFFILTLLFFASIYLGYFTAENFPGMAKGFVEKFSSEFGFIKKLPPFGILAIIFLNNTVKSFVAMLLGLLFGIIPVLFVFINGYLIGVVVYVVGGRIGMDRVLMLLIPHGVLEIPAVLLACSYGVWLGKMVLKKMAGKDVSLGECIDMAVRAYIKTVVPLLLVAAFVETFITPHIA